jgi:hypothetical protein
MASIERRPNGRWRARYRLHPGRPQRARHFDRKVDAERFLTRVQGQLLDGSYTHLWPDNEEHTRAAVDDVLGRAGGRDERSG